MQRNPSHFGSYSHPSPSGISSASLANIGANGGCSGRDIVAHCVGSSESQVLVRVAACWSESLVRDIPTLATRINVCDSGTRDGVADV